MKKEFHMSQTLKNQYSISIAKKAAAGDAVALAQLGNAKAFALGFASFLADLVAAGVATMAHIVTTEPDEDISELLRVLPSDHPLCEQRKFRVWLLCFGSFHEIFAGVVFGVVCVITRSRNYTNPAFCLLFTFFGIGHIDRAMLVRLSSLGRCRHFERAAG